MSMWQWKKLTSRPLVVPDRYKYIGKLFVLSTSLHFFAFVALLFLYQINNPIHFNILLNRDVHNAKIVFVPLVKTIPSSLNSITKMPNKSNKQAMKKVTHRGPTKNVEKKNKPIKKNEPIKPKPQPTKTTLANKEIKQQIKKIEPKKVTSVAKPKQTPKLIEKKEEQKKDIIYLGRDDKILLDIQQEVQNQLEKVWHPPVGLSKDLICSYKVKIDKNGSVLDLAIEESSQVISYDIAARSALTMISFPKNLWAKEVVVTFKQ